MIVTVDTTAKMLHADGRSISCSIGRSGAVAADAKREGDHMTPLGEWPIRAALFRPDRSAPPPGFALPWRWIRPDDGWCDDPADTGYNRPVRLPYPASAERMWRGDHAYDIVLILGHNDAPPVPGIGSAIFFHLTNDRPFTEGCIAVGRTAIDALLPKITRESRMVIGRE